MASQRFLSRSSILIPKFASPVSTVAPKGISSTLCISRPVPSRLSTKIFARTRFATTIADSTSIPNSPPEQRSRLRQFGTFLLLGFLSTATGFIVMSVPAMAAANDFMSPPTDAETLEMFVAPDDFSAEVNETLKNHPIAQALRQNEDFTEARPYFKIPESARSHFLTGGILSGPGLIWVPPFAFAEKEGKSLTILYYLGNDLGGHPGIVHGGLQATLLDEALARCSMGALPNKISMTANLNINYKAPMPTNSYIVCKAELEKVEGRKAWVKGRMESAVADGETPVVYVEASGLFIEPKQAAAMKRLYPAAVSST